MLSAKIFNRQKISCFMRKKIFTFIALCLLSAIRLWAVTPVLTGAGIGRAAVPLPVGADRRPESVTLEYQLLLADLYPGLAVVRSEMILSNNNDRAVKVRLGLPYGGSFFHDEISVVKLDSLYGLRVFWKKSPLAAVMVEGSTVPEGIRPSLPGSYRDSVDRWYAWELAAPAHSRDTMVILYAVRTGPAELARGGNLRRSFFFGFLLEGSRGWDGQPQSTLLQITLKGKPKRSQIYAVYPREAFKNDTQGRLYFSVIGRNPIGHDNVLIGYDSRDNFDYFSDFLKDNEKYYGLVAKIDPDSAGLRTFSSGRFDVYPTKEYTVMGVLAACLGLVALLVIYLIKRR